jgi:KipI family sensor histidine kinase inhibitor
MNFTYTYLSSTCIEYNFGSIIDKKTSDWILKVYKFLPHYIDFKDEGIIDLVPSYCSLTIHFNSLCKLFDDPHAYDAWIYKALEAKSLDKPLQHTVYVNYNGEDLDTVCNTLKLTKNEFINLHAGSYPIAMIGFRAYFPYLLGLDKKLNLPRREAPRKCVPKGSVAIAAGQTGIYPEDLPGGWHIIGHTDFDAFESLKPSDIINFKAKDTHAD